MRLKTLHLGWTVLMLACMAGALECLALARGRLADRLRGRGDRTPLAH